MKLKEKERFEERIAFIKKDNKELRKSNRNLRKLIRKMRRQRYEHR